ncbi:extracellular solute-binding protein [Acuticoccus sp.]|uniref:extracellular solute-binding protein n=1 Tax=Acuticoccus sp. TaxID=1904378 RepID=UPI003B522981
MHMVLKGALALTCALALGATAQAEVSEIRMVEAGGRSGDSIEEGYVKPFTEKTGIKVVRENPNPLGKLKAMVESGTITAPLFEVGSTSWAIADASGLIEPLDWDAIDPDPMFEEARKDNAFGYQYYSTLLAWRDDAEPLETWADFWNVEEFPGDRTLPDNANLVIPMALLADGVAPDALYPLDLDRAFEKLSEIAPHVSVWWSAGAQPPQMLQDNEVQYAASYSGRVAGLEGIDFTYNQGLLDLAYFVVPKGADPQQKAAAMGLLKEMSVAKNQAVAAEVIPYTGASPELDALLPADKKDQFPVTEANREVQALANPQWWAENRDAVEERWLEFKLGL